MLICGRYEGIDQRVADNLVDEEISIGDFVLSGGELPAMVITDAIVRLIPGAIGDAESALKDSFQDYLLLCFPIVCDTISSFSIHIIVFLICLSCLH